MPQGHLHRPLLPLIAIYAAVCLLWIGFANGIAPSIIAAAYNERSLPILNWAFHGHTSTPLEHYLDRWSVIAGAVPIAAILHLVIVLFVRNTGEALRPSLCSNFVLITFSAVFLAVTVLSWVSYWAHGDYWG